MSARPIQLAARELGDLRGATMPSARLKSKVSSVFISGKRAVVQTVPHGGVATRGLLGREDFVQKLLVAPVLLASLARERLEDARDAGHLERSRLARRRGPS